MLADSDGIGDGVIKVARATAYYALDGMKWLLGDEAIAGETSSEVDVPMAHTKKQDIVWFYSTIFLAPALVLGVGWLHESRRKPQGQEPAAPGNGKGRATRRRRP